MAACCKGYGVLAGEEEVLHSFLVRVDIMCLDSGKWVVNEFESLEAYYFSPDSRDTEATLFLVSFWRKQLHACISKLLG